MNYKKINSWIEPITVAQKISENYNDDWVFLYSGLNEEINDSKSIIGLFAKNHFKINKIKDLKKVINDSQNKLFGYISYEAFNDIEDILQTKQNSITNNKIHLIDFGLIIEFYHDTKIIKIFYDNLDLLKKIESWLNKTSKKTKKQISVKNISSNFSDQSYIEAIKNIKKEIAKGEFYQVNLTRKFFGKLDSIYNNHQLLNEFIRLTKISPANYSSFLKIDKKTILSSSPELFIKIDDEKILSRPIKGTITRNYNFKKDQKNKEYLANNIKEKAENLMIVDLVRNDLARICQPNSVKVKNLFAINSYSTVHHMSSEIHGTIKKDSTIFDIIKATFPAGSMTGAPKIAAMNNIAKNEKYQRGIYSGAIGFIGKKNSHLSVVIRTLIIEDDNFEFQVGGAITHDSKPKKELNEIYSKARAINKLLNLDEYCKIKSQ